ncbi:class I SAM-dependent methyltransferase [Microbulbifer sp. VAAC004]|uniref:class I SAM-dependent methyltransferase n=1 Tax=unclassified Microbulbifer TaxID=2619833 RepID=UPI004039CD79
MKENTDFFVSKSLASWDEAGPVHWEFSKRLLEKVSESNFNALEQDFDGMLDGFDLSGKSVVQICCNNAKDLISIKKKGAGLCVGIDGSQAFVDQARLLVNASRCSDVEIVCSNIYELPDEYIGRFDFAVITIGVLNWMPDLKQFMRICTSLLKPGGYLLMEEIHPVLNMYEEGNPSHIAMSYFNREPQKDDQGLGYLDGRKYQAKENYNFHHTLSDILMAAIESNLSLKKFVELGKNVGNWCGDLESSECVPPMAMLACWKKDL